jgi:hypothetical protein
MNELDAERLAQAMNDFELRADLPALVETNRGSHRADCAHVDWIAQRYAVLAKSALAAAARALLECPADQELLRLDRLNDLSVALWEYDREAQR